MKNSRIRLVYQIFPALARGRDRDFAAPFPHLARFCPGYDQSLTKNQKTPKKVTAPSVDIREGPAPGTPVSQGFAHYPHGFPHRYVNAVPGEKVRPRRRRAGGGAGGPALWGDKMFAPGGRDRKKPGAGGRPLL